MSYRKETETNKKDSNQLITEKNSKDICFPQDTYALNVCLKDQTDLVDISSLGDENQDTDPHNFTSDQINVQSHDVKVSSIGDHETQESEGGEADLHKYLVGCKKNPGHRQFIPVDTFTLKHLPEGFQDNDLYEYIKVKADQTVRVDVTVSSPRRPRFWPNTTYPYPFYNMSERKTLRTGSGYIYNLIQLQNGVTLEDSFRLTKYTKCCCRKCKDSDSPSNVWWEFNVNTATHVVFDDIEAIHTTLRFFYNRDGSTWVSVDNVRVEYANVEHDWCRLNCVTCDTTLGNKIMEIFKDCETAWAKVRINYFLFSTKHKFNFIVSHPHGCSKQISFGQWKERLEVGDRSKLTYTTCTCPGSSGAHVHLLGFEDFWTWSDLVHSGSFKSGYNYSGVGLIF